MGLREDAGIEDGLDVFLGVVDEGEGCDGAGFDAEDGFEVLSEAEGFAGVEDGFEGFEGDGLVFLCGDEPEGMVFVAQEEVFGVRAGDVAAQVLAVVDGEQGRMSVDLEGDVVPAQERQEGGAHGGLTNKLGAGQVPPPHLTMALRSRRAQLFVSREVQQRQVCYNLQRIAWLG